MEFPIYGATGATPLDREEAFPGMTKIPTIHQRGLTVLASGGSIFAAEDCSQRGLFFVESLTMAINT